MSQNLKVSARLLDRVAQEFTADEAAEALDILALLRAADSTEELDELSDHVTLYAPIVYHHTLGEHVAWTRTSDAVVVANIDRYRPPPPDLP